MADFWSLLQHILSTDMKRLRERVGARVGRFGRGVGGGVGGVRRGVGGATVPVHEYSATVQTSIVNEVHALRKVLRQVLGCTV